MYIDVGKLDRRGRYRAMTEVIAPRPIAWILTDNGPEPPAEERWNLAPFSYFMGICSDPAQVMISIGHSLFEERTRKDTYENLLHRPQCVIHIPSLPHVQDVEYSARTYGHGESELKRLGLEVIPFEGSPVPRLKNVRVALACSATRFVPVAEGESQMMVIADVRQIFIDDGVLDADADTDGAIDLLRLDPAGRAGRGQYVGIRSPRVVERYPEGWSD